MKRFRLIIIIGFVLFMVLPAVAEIDYNELPDKAPPRDLLKDAPSAIVDPLDKDASKPLEEKLDALGLDRKEARAKMEAVEILGLVLIILSLLTAIFLVSYVGRRLYREYKANRGFTNRQKYVLLTWFLLSGFLIIFSSYYQSRSISTYGYIDFREDMYFDLFIVGVMAITLLFFFRRK